MSWFKNKIRVWLNGYGQDEKVACGSSSGGLEIDSDGLRFRIVPADGGFVAEFRTYDSVKDRSKTNVYIITHDQDLSKRMSEIITMEVLRK